MKKERRSSESQKLDTGELVKDLERIALLAGLEIMKIYKTDFDIEEKADGSPVTVADKRAETLILNELASIAPDIPVISEEAASIGTIPDVGKTLFLIDPLDGTKEFRNRNGEFTVNIALVENGRPKVGVVYAPAMFRLFLSYGQNEAYEKSAVLNLKDSIAKTTKARKISVSPADPNALVALTSRSHRDTEKTDEYLSKFNIGERIGMGSSVKICLIAAGEADIYPRLGPTKEWDTAAGHAILDAAGGKLTQIDGSAFEYGKWGEKLINPNFVAKGNSATNPTTV